MVKKQKFNFGFWMLSCYALLLRIPLKTLKPRVRPPAFQRENPALQNHGISFYMRPSCIRIRWPHWIRIRIHNSGRLDPIKDRQISKWCSASRIRTPRRHCFCFFNYIPCTDCVLYLELVLADLLQLEFFLLCLAHDVDGPGSKKSRQSVKTVGPYYIQVFPR